MRRLTLAVLAACVAVTGGNGPLRAAGQPQSSAATASSAASDAVQKHRAVLNG